MGIWSPTARLELLERRFDAGSAALIQRWPPSKQAGGDYRVFSKALGSRQADVTHFRVVLQTFCQPLL